MGINEYFLIKQNWHTYRNTTGTKRKECKNDKS